MWNVVRFLCQELKIDFDRSFGIDFDDPLNSLTLIIPLCTDCNKLFDKVGRIQVMMDETRRQLQEVLAKIQDSVIGEGRSKDGKNVSKNCRILRTEIIQSAGGKRTSENVQMEESPGRFTIVEPELVSEFMEVEVKVEKVETNEEDEEELPVFDDPIVEPDQQLNAQNVGQKIESCIVSKSITSSKSNFQKSKGRKRKSEYKRTYRCDLCDDKKELFTDIYSFKIHIQNFHKSASMIYFCSKPDCNKKFPVEVLLKAHMIFHEEEVMTPYSCEDCEKTFKNLQALNRHSLWHERVIGRRKDRSRCRFCNKMTSIYPINVRKHEIKDHQDQLIHSCDSCEQSYSTPDILETHMQSHYMEGPYQCRVCKAATFEVGNALEDHLVQCHIPRDKPTKTNFTDTDTNCRICGRCFDSQQKLNRHLRRSHNEGKIKIYTCDLCSEETFTTYAAKLKHVLTCHETGVVPRLSCPIPGCPKQFATTFMLERHCKNHSSHATKPLSCEICYARFLKDDHAGLERHKFNVHENCGRKQSRNFPCLAANCSKRFQIRGHLRRHERKYHPELLIYCCTLCDKMYSVVEHLETHMKTHADVATAGPFGCTVCVAQLSTTTLLALHLLTHTGENKIQCTKCTRTLMNHGELRVHMIRAHGAKKPFQCELCEKLFVTRPNLINHKEQAHPDQIELPTREPKICKQCGLQFRTGKRLGIHIKNRHTPKIARVCEICGKAVISFADHMRMHAGDKRHVCYFCDKRFVRIHSLRCHIYTHTGEKPYICHICHLEFNQQHCLKGHLKNVHMKNGTFFPKPAADVEVQAQAVQWCTPDTFVTLRTDSVDASEAEVSLNPMISLDFDNLMD